MPTFAEAAERLIEQKRPGWRNASEDRQWRSSLRRYAFPHIGARPVAEVNSTDVLAILTPIWHTRAATAKSVRQRIAAVLEWAVVMEFRNDNPCDRVGRVLGANLFERRRWLMNDWQAYLAGERRPEDSSRP